MYAIIMMQAAMVVTVEMRAIREFLVVKNAIETAARMMPK